VQSNTPVSKTQDDTTPRLHQLAAKPQFPNMEAKGDDPAPDLGKQKKPNYGAGERNTNNLASEDEIRDNVQVIAGLPGDEDMEITAEELTLAEGQLVLPGISQELADFLSTTGSTIRGSNAIAASKRLAIILSRAIDAAQDAGHLGTKYGDLKRVEQLFNEAGEMTERAEDLIFADLSMENSKILEGLGFKRKNLVAELPTLVSVFPMMPYEARAKKVAARAGKEHEQLAGAILAGAIFEFVIMNVSVKYMSPRLMNELASALPPDWVTESKLTAMRGLVAYSLSSAQIRALEYVAKSKLGVEQRQSGGDMAAALMHALNAVATSNAARTAAANAAATQAVSVGSPAPIEVQIDSHDPDEIEEDGKPIMLRTAASVLKGLDVDLSRLRSQIMANALEGKKVPRDAGIQLDTMQSFTSTMSNLIFALHSGTSLVDAKTQLATALTDLFSLSMSAEAADKAVIVLQAMHDAGISISGLKPTLLLPTRALEEILSMLESAPDQEAVAVVAGLRAQIALEKSSMDAGFRKRLLHLLAAALGKPKLKDEADEKKIEEGIQAQLDELLGSRGFAEYAKLMKTAISDMRSHMEAPQWNDFRLSIIAACEAAGIKTDANTILGIMRDCQVGYSFMMPEAIMSGNTLRQRSAIVDAAYKSPHLTMDQSAKELEELYKQEPSIVTGHSIQDLNAKMSSSIYMNSLYAAKKMAASIDAISGSTIGSISMTMGAAIMVQEQYTRYSLQLGKTVHDFMTLFKIIAATGCHLTLRVPPSVGESRGCTLYISSLADLPRDALYAMIVPDGTAETAAFGVLSYLVGMGMGHQVTLRVGSDLQHQAAVNHLRLLGQEAIASIHGPSTITMLKFVRNETFTVQDLKSHNVAICLTSLVNAELFATAVGEYPGIKDTSVVANTMLRMVQEKTNQWQKTKTYLSLPKYAVTAGGYILNEQRQCAGILRAAVVSEGTGENGADEVGFYILLTGPPVATSHVLSAKTSLYVNLVNHGYMTFTELLNVLGRESLMRASNTIVQGILACNNLSSLDSLGMVTVGLYKPVKLYPRRLALSPNPIIEETISMRVEFTPLFTDKYCLCPNASTSISVEGTVVVRPPAVTANIPQVRSVALNDDCMILSMKLIRNSFPDEIFSIMATMFGGMVSSESVSCRYWTILARTCAKIFRNETVEAFPSVALHGMDRKCMSVEVLYIPGLPVRSAENPSFSPTHKLMVEAVKGGVPVNLMVAFITRFLGLTVTIAASGRSLVLVCSHIQTALSSSHDMGCRFYSGFKIADGVSPSVVGTTVQAPKQQYEPVPPKQPMNSNDAAMAAASFAGIVDDDEVQEGDAEPQSMEEEQEQAENVEESESQHPATENAQPSGPEYVIQMNTPRVGFKTEGPGMTIGNCVLRPVRWNDPASRTNPVYTVEEWKEIPAGRPVDRQSLVAFLVNLDLITEDREYMKKYEAQNEKTVARIREALESSGLSAAGALQAMEDAVTINSFISHKQRAMKVTDMKPTTLAQAFRAAGPGPKKIVPLNARTQEAYNRANEASARAYQAQQVALSLQRTTESSKKDENAKDDKKQPMIDLVSDQFPSKYNRGLRTAIATSYQHIVQKPLVVDNAICEMFEAFLDEYTGQKPDVMMRVDMTAFISALTYLLVKDPNDNVLLQNYPALSTFWDTYGEGVVNDLSERSTDLEANPQLDEFDFDPRNPEASAIEMVERFYGLRPVSVQATGDDQDNGENE